MESTAPSTRVPEAQQPFPLQLATRYLLQDPRRLRNFFEMTLALFESTEIRRPNGSEGRALALFCEMRQLPLLSSEQVIALMGLDPRRVWAASDLEGWCVNKQAGILVKYARTLNKFKAFLQEAMVIHALDKEHGTRRLVGVCPQGMCLVVDTSVKVPREKRSLRDESEATTTPCGEQVVLEEHSDEAPNMHSLEDKDDTESKTTPCGEQVVLEEQSDEAPSKRARYDKDDTESRTTPCGEQVVLEEQSDDTPNMHSLEDKDDTESRTTPCGEQVVPEEQRDEAPSMCVPEDKDPSASGTTSGSDSFESQRESLTPEAAPPTRTKAKVFEECLHQVFSIVFRDADVPRRPCVEEVQFLAQFCLNLALPVASSQQLTSWAGRMPKHLSQSENSQTLLGEHTGLVMKFAATLNNFRSFLLEAMFLKLFGAHNGIQNLVGVCPESLCLVTEYAGHTLGHYMTQSRLSVEHKHLVLKQICSILRMLHSHDFAHNDLHPGNVCVKMTVSGPNVFFIDFGLTLPVGTQPRLGIEWHEGLHYAPEICGSENPGSCSRESDIYALGHLVRAMSGGEQMPPLISRWVARSQLARPSERASIAELEEAMDLQRVSELRGCNSS